MAKIKLVKYHPLFAYDVGDVFEVNEADTKMLLDGGYAIEDVLEDDAKIKEQEEAEAKAKADAEAAEYARLKEQEEAEAKAKADADKSEPHAESVPETATDKAADAALNDARNKGKQNFNRK